MEVGMGNIILLYRRVDRSKLRTCFMTYHAIIIILFGVCVPNKLQACCYLAGYTFTYGVYVCTTSEECTEPAKMTGCTVSAGSNGGYMITCNGENSGCAVNPNINCCALYPDSYGCIGGYSNPCLKNPKYPCCINKKCDQPPKQCETDTKKSASQYSNRAGYAGE